MGTSLVLVALTALAGLALALRLVRGGLQPIAVDLAGIEVRTADGDPVRIGDLVVRPTLLVLVRYYG